ncbi:MAG: nicotinate phosphoribosyltransferase [Clostridia bacterium]
MKMRNLSMLTDYYQLTMANGYYLEGRSDREAIFDIFFRDIQDMNFAVFAGLEQAVDYLMNLKFTDDDIEFLRDQHEFDESFLEHLKEFKFTGDVYAVPEGSIVFPMEPLMTIKAPIEQAQIIETALLTIINHQTLIATKASRVKFAAGNAAVLEFGLRRAQGPDAGIYGARAAVIGGCDATSNVYSAKEFGIKPKGTHSHSWVMSFPDELTSFREYARLYPNNCLLLVDTYDTLKSGVPNAIKVFKEMRERGCEPSGIRLDSGDLSYLSKKARVMLDEAGFPNAKICASSDLDENLIQSLNLQGAKIDIWGVGTKLITSFDLPALGGVYKMSAIEEDGKLIPKIKVSDNAMKITNPGYKTIYRIYDNKTDKALADLIGLRSENLPTDEITIFHPLETWKQMVLTDYYIKDLHKLIIKRGELVYDMPKFGEICDYAKKDKATFWEEYQRIQYPQEYKVDLTKELYDLKQGMLKTIGKIK